MLRLRPYEPSDAAHIISWIKDEEAFRRWSADRYDAFPITADELNAHYSVTNPDTFMVMTAVEDGNVIGHMTMRYTSVAKDQLRFGFVIVDDRIRGKGYGKSMLKEALRFAFDTCRVSQVTLGVFANNPAAYHCYTSVGFCGITTDQPEYYHIMNEDWLCIEMCITENEYRTQSV